ncbi:MAG TPA: SprT family zinc-dependent metalloprotease [Devosia sp.]|nr:SprT family zinc-dependent metalloprotease [Devosia sp.]
MIALFQKKWPATVEALIDGKPVTVAVRVSARARNYRLSLPHAGGPVLTVPRHGNWKEASDFFNRQLDWLGARLKDAAKPVTFRAGVRIPVRGIEHRIVATGGIRGRVAPYEEDGELLLAVPGEPAHRARRLTDWLKAEATVDLSKRCTIHARHLGVEYKAISMRSQSTRWGSCSSTGRLNFNWRLVLAPPFVLDYVAAHEVAHLLEMNHSDRFWARVEETLPTMERGREWLRLNGRQLMVYGIDA